MDLFFGPSKSRGSGRPSSTVNIRVEERVVSGSKKRKANPTEKPHRRVVTENDAGPSADNNTGKSTKRRAINTSSMSRKDRVVVNANRERVGSLPGTPRRHNSPTPPKKGKVHKHGKVSNVTNDPVKQNSEERSASVPPPRQQAPPPSSPLATTKIKASDSDNDGDVVGKGLAPMVSSVDAVSLSETNYVEYFKWRDEDSSRQDSINLYFPEIGASERFSLLMPQSYNRETESKDEYLPVNDLISTVRAISTYMVSSEQFKQAVCDDEQQGVLRQLERARNRRNGNDFVQAVHRFNELLEIERKAGRTGPCFDLKDTPSEMAIHITEQVYNRIVAPKVDMLRQYKAFSNNVYGEILPTLISEFIERTNITSATRFMDLGCGIGNVVLQVAAQTGCRASGVEIMKVPARFGERQANEFEHRMRQYMFPQGKIQIWRGDFCDSSLIHKQLPEADVLLVNNYAFDSALNQNLLQIFLDLKEGAKIISLKPFVTPDYKINARNIYSTESILTVQKYSYWSQCVSWTDNGGDYYVQTVDRTRVKAFLSLEKKSNKSY